MTSGWKIIIQSRLDDEVTQACQLLLCSIFIKVSLCHKQKVLKWRRDCVEGLQSVATVTLLYHVGAHGEVRLLVENGEDLEENLEETLVCPQGWRAALLQIACGSQAPFHGEHSDFCF